MLAIGGWADSSSNKYSRLVSDPNARKAFIDHVIPFLKSHNFDGLDLDWEYPKCWQVYVIYFGKIIKGDKILHE